MSTSMLTVIAAASAACLLTSPPSAQALDPWQTVDDFPARSATTYFSDIAADPVGRIFTVGHDNLGDGTYLNFLRYSTDGGATWLSSSDSHQAGAFTDIVAGPDGHLYAGAGLQDPSTGLTMATVLQSTDFGESWVLLDSWSSAPGGAGIHDLSFDSHGNLYAACFAGSGTWNLGSRWVVRKGSSSGGGFSWSTADSFRLTKGGDANANTIVTRPHPGGPDEILVGGSARNSLGEFWMVRTSLDGGATWRTVDSYQYVAKTGGNHVRDMLAAPDGSLYTFGNMTYGTKTAWKQGGWVRFSRNGGQTWQNGSFPLNRYAVRMAADTLGNLFAFGYWGDASETYRSTDRGVTWQISDVPGGKPVTDALGNVYTQWNVTDAGGTVHSLVRGLAAP